MSITRTIIQSILAFILLVISILCRKESSISFFILISILIIILMTSILGYMFPKKRLFLGIRKGYFYIWTLGIMLFLSLYMIGFASVNGTSMQPTVSNHMKILIYKFSYTPKKNDVVVIALENRDVIKRIVAVEGDKIEFILEEDQYILYINEKKHYNQYGQNYEVQPFAINALTQDLKEGLYVKKNHYFVLGDNAINSEDSRSMYVKTIVEKQILGKAIVSYYPKIGGIK